ncbi:hypothetical protein QBC36DRAFT_297525 [Triangularia setosa]|uniref:Uncharacterized protein n=1 Tax=Triangularia setosa TaxID=2587417 RepID=A0AAN6WHL2_9PEZI|nr:hypothetical protein QBC36DRAFT_297525 [Podospora setosa]
MTTESTSAAAPQSGGEKTAAPSTGVSNSGGKDTSDSSSNDSSRNDSTSTMTDAFSDNKSKNAGAASLPESIPKKPTSSEMYSASHYE